jgi:CBS domain-containing membrane protein
MLKPLLKHTARLETQRITGHLGWLRGAVGAGLGIGLAGWVGLVFAGASDGLYPMLVAPLGASAVLVFAIPASPLAQPWPVIGGDLLSAMVGLAAGMLLGDPVISAAAGVCVAIAVMTMARCLHPPGGACALLCALGATGAESWDFGYMLPIAANVLMLVLVGWLYNNFTGHRWPHVQYPVPRQTMPFPHPGTYRRSDIEEVLADWNEMLDVDVDDLDAVFRAVERKAAKRALADRPE